MSKQDENQPTGNEPEDNGGAGTPASQDDGGSTPPAGGSDGGKLTDKHGEEAINLGHHNRLMAEKDDEIAELKKQLAASRSEAEKAADALKQIAELKGQLADEKVSNALKLAGCVNEKAAKAVLGDYEGDVSKLAEACPYLFGGNAGTRRRAAPAQGTPARPETRRTRTRSSTSSSTSSRQLRSSNGKQPWGTCFQVHDPP